MSTRLAMIAGACPGVGKTTVSSLLAERLRTFGTPVEYVEEPDFIGLPAFGEVFDSFFRTNEVAPELILEAARKFVEDRNTQGRLTITDSQFPFVTSLLAWGYEPPFIRTFLKELTTILAPLNPVFLFIDGDIRSSLQRACQSRGEDWNEAFFARMSLWRVEPPILDMDSAAAHFSYDREITLAAVKDMGWHLEVLDGQDLPEMMVTQAISLLNSCNTEGA